MNIFPLVDENWLGQKIEREQNRENGGVWGETGYGKFWTITKVIPIHNGNNRRKRKREDKTNM